MSQQTHCGHCGAALRAGAKFCPACGAAAGSTPSNTPAADKIRSTLIPHRAGMVWNLVIGAVLLASAALGTVYHWATTPTEPTAITPAEAKALIGQVQLSATLADDKTPESPAGVFTPDTPVIYCTFHLNKGAENAVVKAQWIAEDVGPTTPLDQVLRESTFAAPASIGPDNDRGQMSIAAPGKTWPVGKYRVDLYVNDDKALSVPFVVSRDSARQKQTKPAPKPRTASKRKSSTSDLFPFLKPGIEPLYHPRAIPVPRGLSRAQVESIVNNAMSKVGWNPSKKAAGGIEGKFYLFGSRATIDVRYSTRAVTIRYRSSKKLDYRKSTRGATINKLYNSWVKDLENEIRARFKEH